MQEPVPRGQGHFGEPHRPRAVGRPLLVGAFALVAILFSVLFWTGTDATLLFHYDDAAYHLAAAQGFVRAGGPVTWQFWGSLPGGRPNNYPPLFALIISFFLKLGMTPALAGKAAAFAGLAGGGAVFAWALAKLFDVRIALVATLFLFLTWDFFSISLLVVPATAVVLLAPAALYALSRERWLALGGIVTFMLYTHTTLPYVVVGALFLWCAVFSRDRLLGLLSAFLASVVASLPWLIPLLLGGVPYLKYWYPSLVPHARFVELNLIALGFLGAGLWALARRREAPAERDRHFFFFLMLWVCLLPIAAFVSTRGLNGHAFAASAPLSALGFLFLIGRRKFARYAALSLGALLFAGTLYLHVAFPVFAAPAFARKTRVPSEWLGPAFSSFGVVVERSTVAELATSALEGDRGGAAGEERILEMVKAGSGEGEAIATLFDAFHDRTVAPEFENYPALYFGGMSGRPVVNAGRPEFLFSGQPLERARLMLTNVPRGEWAVRLGRYASRATLGAIGERFEFVGEGQSGNDAVYVYRNPAREVIREAPAKPLVPLGAALALCALLALAVGRDLNATQPLVRRGAAPRGGAL